MYEFSLKSVIGIILLTTNQIFGWGGKLFCIYIARKTSRNFFYALGTGIYALSWGMAALGVILAGPEGIELTGRLFRLYGWKTAMVLVFIVALSIYIYKREKIQEKQWLQK